MWIYINNLDQVIWLAENWKWVWHFNSFSMTRINTKILNSHFNYLRMCLKQDWMCGKHSVASDEGLHCSSLSVQILRINMVAFHQDWPASVAQLDAPSDWRPGGHGFNPHRGRQHSFVTIDHEIFSTVILSLPLIQEGQLSVSGERMCTILVKRLED